MSEPSAPSEPQAPGRAIPTLARWVLALGLVAVAGVLLWHYYGSRIWAEYKVLRKEVRASEDTVPVGYVGLNYRRSYNDRPPVFEVEKNGKKLLFAAKREDGDIDFYDITEADRAFDVKCLEGGFGRDSIPGVDHPIIETPGSPQGHSLPDRHAVFGVALGGEVRAYPKGLIEKIEVVNDRLGGTAIVLVYDRSRNTAFAYDRKLRDGLVTLGTTGYSCKNQPVLYDRKTKSLWLFQGDQLACLNGPHQGEVLTPVATVQAQAWADWLRQNPKTTVLFGNDRKQPIPSE